MAAETRGEETEVQVCPYLRQVEADWLSMDAGGFYCWVQRGRVKVMHGGERLSVCLSPDFCTCQEYQFRELERSRESF